MSDKPNILIVDDNIGAVKALKVLLRDPNWNIIEATSGQKALEVLLERSIACLITDVKMPDMDGFELAELIRGDRRLDCLPIIFVSGYDKETIDIERLYKIGATDYILKPLNPAEIYHKVSFMVEMFSKGGGETSEKCQSKQVLSLKNESEWFHDFRSKLGIINDWVHVLDQELPAERGQDTQKALEYIKESVIGLNSLLEILFKKS